VKRNRRNRSWRGHHGDRYRLEPLQLGRDRARVERQLAEPEHPVVIGGADSHDVVCRASNGNPGAGAGKHSPVSRRQRNRSQNLAVRLTRGTTRRATYECKRNHRRSHTFDVHVKDTPAV